MKFLDSYVGLLLATVALAAMLPVRGDSAILASVASQAGIALLFFLHGARLAPSRVRAAMVQWRLHGVVLAVTFVAFPVVVLVLYGVLGGTMAEPLATGLIFLGCLSSTVQSSVGFTAIAKGNVPEAMVSASLSNLIGIVLTPVLVALLLHRTGAPISPDMVVKLGVQLLLPFAAGQTARPLIGAWLERRQGIVGFVDRGAILLVVYVAFSEAMTGGVLRTIAPRDLALVAGACALLLAAALGGTLLLGRAAGFSRGDRNVLLFCGSKKSIVSGVPLAGILFPAAMAGAVLVPVILYHQFQLIVGAMIAGRYARAAASDGDVTEGGV